MCLLKVNTYQLYLLTYARTLVDNLTTMWGRQRIDVNYWLQLFNTLWPEQNGCHFADDILKFIFLNGNCCILIKISLRFCSWESDCILIKILLTFVPESLIDNKSALIQIIAWSTTDGKPLSNVNQRWLSSLLHKCITGTQWVYHRNTLSQNIIYYIFSPKRMLSINNIC